MTYKLHISNDDNLGEFAKAALQECLYEDSEWEMKYWLEDILSDYPNSALSIISLLEIDNKIIGACLFSSGADGTVQTYIKPEYRRMGYGSILITNIISVIPDNYRISVVEGIPESVLFFEKMIDLGLITEDQLYRFPVEN